MNRFIAPLAMLIVLFASNMAHAATTFASISYHDVRDVVAADYDPDQYAISTGNLASHFRWLSDHGYTPVSVSEILDAHAGGAPLPEKAVLLTFDDGYRSHYTRVFPLLKAFNYPAVFSLVTHWMSQPAGASIAYGREPKNREDFLSWNQAREMQASGLVEFASHSHDLHKGIHANPQGNEIPAAVARKFSDGHYENRHDYLQRLRSDLGRSVEILRRELGVRPKIMTWPYGKFSADSVRVAGEFGLDTNLTLETGHGSVARPGLVPRYLALANPAALQLAEFLLLPERPAVVRAAHVKLDDLYDPDPAQQETNLSLLLNRVRALEISHVFLQAYSDLDDNGAADALYFPNRHLPVREDLFSRVAWQLKTRAEVMVFAELPILAFETPGLFQSLYVAESLLSGTRSDPQKVPRLSPFSAANRKFITEIYADLAAHADFDGLLFDDDGQLGEFEDASPAGQGELEAFFDSDFSFSQLREDADASARWHRHKQASLSGFTDALASQARRWHPELKAARKFSIDATLHPNRESGGDPLVSSALHRYDFVEVSATPYTEDHSGAANLLDAMAARVTESPLGPQRVIVALPTEYPLSGEEISAAELSAHMRRLQSLGVRHFSWGPDDFLRGKPDLEILREGASLADYTHRRR